MEQEQDFFSNITPTSGELIIIALGALLLVGAIRRWKWTLDMTGQRSSKPFGFLTLMQDFFGEEGVREFGYDFEQGYELIASEEITSIFKAHGLVINKDLREVRVI